MKDEDENETMVTPNVKDTDHRRRRQYRVQMLRQRRR